MNSPTVARRALARILKQAREDAGKTGAQAAKHAGINPGTLSRIENSETKVAPGTAMLLTRYYGAEDDVLDLAVDLAHAGRERSWWQQYKTIPTWFDGYIGLEMEASEIRSYQAELIPGLLQVEEYSRAQSRISVDVHSDEQVEQRTAVRKARQERLRSENPVQLHTVVNEAALHRRVGGTETMRAQLKHLANVSELPNVTLQILGFESGEHPAHQGAFTTLSFPAHMQQRIELPDIVYVEYGAGSLYLEDAHVVDDFSKIFTGVSDRALAPEQSIQLIRDLLDERY